MGAYHERQDVEKWFSQLNQIKATANQSLVLLSVMMQQCEVWGYRDNNTNPCQRLKRYKEKGKERYLTPDELRQLWRALETLEHDYPIAVIVIRILVYTGGRSSEVRTLHWDEYRGGHWHLSDSKAGAKIVYVGQVAQRLVSQLRKKYAGYQSEDVFPLLSGFASKPTKVHTVWIQVRTRAEIKGVRIHDLRHTFASYAVLEGYPIPMAAKLLRHKRISSTLRYTHVGDVYLETEAQKIGQAINGIYVGKKIQPVKEKINQTKHNSIDDKKSTQSKIKTHPLY